MLIPKINIPILLVGPPGAGKTANVNDSFDFVYTSLASSATEEDIAGIPYKKGEYDFKTIPEMFRVLHEEDKKGKTTALFFDELDKARRSVADTLLTLIASRRVGSSVLPERTSIIAAANPPEFGGGDGISDAMISRFSVIEYRPCPESWARWARKRYTSSKADKVIRSIEIGEMPIFDIVGEGLRRRITSPRTISYALDIMDSGCSNMEDMVKGLLTASTASQFINIAQSDRNSDMDKPLDIYRKASNLKTTRKPYRV